MSFGRDHSAEAMTDDIMPEVERIRRDPLLTGEKKKELIAALIMDRFKASRQRPEAPVICTAKVIK